MRYQEAGSEPKRVEWYDSGHNLPLEAIVALVEATGSQEVVAALRETGLDRASGR